MEFEKIREIIAEQLGIAKEKIQPETNFAKDLGADSLDIYQVITVLEGMFNIEFSNEDAERITTVGDVVNFITNAVNKN